MGFPNLEAVFNSQSEIVLKGRKTMDKGENREEWDEFLLWSLDNSKLGSREFEGELDKTSNRWKDVVTRGKML